MSTIPKLRSHLVEMTRTNFEKLRLEIDQAGSRLASLPCTDEWNAKELLAVRAWWTEAVIEWVRLGRKGKTPITPAEGYRWNETPRLNNDIARSAKRMSFKSVVKRLDDGFAELMLLIDSLDDRELLKVGAFEWAGKYPIARWLSLNTARQYATARTFIRKAMRESGSP